MKALQKWDVACAAGYLLWIASVVCLHYASVYDPWGRAQRVRRSCRVNIEAMALRLWGYAVQHDDVLPETLEQVGYSNLRAQCPGTYRRDREAGRRPRESDYVYVGAGLNLQEIPGPEGCPLLFDKKGNHPDGTRNVLFAISLQLAEVQRFRVECLKEETFQVRLREYVERLPENHVLRERLAPHIEGASPGIGGRTGFRFPRGVLHPLPGARTAFVCQLATLAREAVLYVVSKGGSSTRARRTMAIARGALLRPDAEALGFEEGLA